MKKLLIILALTVLIFGILTLTTATLLGASDGPDSYGYPLTFFIRIYGECFPPCPKGPDGTKFYFFPFLLDLLFAAIIPLLGWMVLTKVKSKLKK